MVNLLDLQYDVLLCPENTNAQPTQFIQYV